MTNRTSEKTSLETARSNLRALFDGYSALTGIPASTAAELVADDRAFVTRYQTGNLTFATYDRTVGRFAWIWPQGGEWPASVPRPEAVSPSEKALAKMREREEKQASANDLPTLPGDADWPSDIPKPGATSTEKMEA